MAKRQRTPSGSVDVNMTPMIDCTFQLIIFFILTAQIANQELVRLWIPRPDDSQALEEKQGEPVFKDRMIVNVVNQYGADRDRDPAKSGTATNYRVAGKDIAPEQVGELRAVLKAAMDEFTEGGGKEGEFYLEIRADRDVYYRDIEPVIQAASTAGFVKMSITAIVDPDLKASAG